MADDLLDAVYEIRELIRLMAGPAIAERDRKLRAELRSIVGASKGKQKAIFLMDGNLTRAEIHRQAKVHEGHLSVLVKNLSKAGLITGDPKQPKLAIAIPANFFEDVEAK